MKKNKEIKSIFETGFEKEMNKDIDSKYIKKYEKKKEKYKNNKKDFWKTSKQLFGLIIAGFLIIMVGLLIIYMSFNLNSGWGYGIFGILFGYIICFFGWGVITIYLFFSKNIFLIFLGLTSWIYIIYIVFKFINSI